MPPDPTDRLSDYTQALLDAAVIILDTTPALAPQSQFICSSMPAIDCEFVAVQAAAVREDATSPMGIEAKRRVDFGNLILVSYYVYIVRCAPMPSRQGPPTDAEKSANTLTVLKDIWVLWNGIRDMQKDLFDGCLGVYFDGALPIAEEGGFLGWRFGISATIPGYEP